MKKKTLLKLSISVAISMAALAGCSKGLKPSDPDVYRNKTGIIGVFRQSAFYCENVMPQYMTLGAQKIMVKSGWSNEQDNLFISEMKPGTAPLYSYEYSCGDDETKFKLDTADNGKKAFPYAVKIPDQGFCKIVISFLDNDNLFSHNDALLKEYFEKNEVAAGYPNIPYCDVIDTKGNVVTFMDRDSLNRELYAEAVKKAKSLTADDIYPLISIDGSSDMASLSGDNSQVILVTWHNSPDDTARPSRTPTRSSGRSPTKNSSAGSAKTTKKSTTGICDSSSSSACRRKPTTTTLPYSGRTSPTFSAPPTTPKSTADS